MTSKSPETKIYKLILSIDGAIVNQHTYIFFLPGQWFVTRGADPKHFVLRKSKLLNDSNHEIKLISIL